MPFYTRRMPYTWPPVHDSTNTVLLLALSLYKAPSEHQLADPVNYHSHSTPSAGQRK